MTLHQHRTILGRADGEAWAIVFMRRAACLVGFSRPLIITDGRQHVFERRCVHTAPPFFLSMKACRFRTSYRTDAPILSRGISPRRVNSHRVLSEICNAAADCRGVNNSL